MSRVTEWESDDFLLEQLHPDWHHEAACRGMDPEVFFPIDSGAHHEAKEVCKGCPVRETCEASGIGEQYGIWGGRTINERRVRRFEARLRSMA